MTTSESTRRAAAALAFSLALFLPVSQGHGQGPAPAKKKPALLLRANPTIALPPAKVQFLAVLEGGDDNYQDYYCPGIEWEWDDDTISESTPDCEPYEAQHSRITRRYSATHVFHQEGNFEVKFKLKRKDDVIALATAVVQVGGQGPQ